MSKVYEAMARLWQDQAPPDESFSSEGPTSTQSVGVVLGRDTRLWLPNYFETTANLGSIVIHAIQLKDDLARGHHSFNRIACPFNLILLEVLPSSPVIYHAR
jgi:hypothetical protein